jgi:hypothetical protein
MKIYNKTFGRVLVTGVAILSLFAMQSCKDEPDKYESTGGTPTIHYIRPADVNAKDSLLVQASPQMVIAMVGDNLRSIKRMFFNDLEAVLNSSYMTDNTLIVSVPKDIPGVVSDKITMITTDQDTVYYDFHVVIPGPSPTSMSNEWAKAGEEVTIYGNYFIDDPNVPLSVIFPGNVVVTDFTSMSYSALTFVMPEVASEGPVSVKSVYGTQEAPFHYKDTRGMLFSFDDPTFHNHGWNGHEATTDETALDGNFLMMGNGTAVLAESTWDEKNFSFVYWPGDDWGAVETYKTSPRLCDVVDFSDWENMSIKFEVNIPKEHPWTNCALQILFAGVDQVTNRDAGVDVYGNTIAAANNAYYTRATNPNLRALYRPWDDTAAKTYDTDGKWVTVTLPIATSFRYASDGTVPTDAVKLDKNSFASLWLFVQGGGVYGEECTPIIKIDNVRVVPNK